MNAIIYARVSSNVQEEAKTIEQQFREIKTYAAKRKIEIVEIIADEAKSGADKNRAVSLVRKLEGYKEIDILLITKYDRLARDLFLQLWIEKELLKMRIKIVAVEQLTLNHDDPLTKAMRQIIGVFAELERNMIQTRLKAGKRYKFEVKRQRTQGPAPFGYRWTGKRHDRYWIIDEKEAALVRMIFELYIEFKSIRGVITRLEEINLARDLKFKISPQGLANILKNRIYIGEIEFEGEVLIGSYDPLISEFHFNRVQKIIKSNIRQK